MRILLFCSVSLLLGGCATSGEIEHMQANINKRLNEIESRVNNQKLMELLHSVEQHEQQLTVMRGDIETLQHDAAEAKKHQNDLYSDLDSRIAELKNLGQVNQNNSPPIADSLNLATQYKNAMDLISRHQFDQALPILSQIVELRDKPNYIADAAFWLGITHTALNQFYKAILAYKHFLQQFPDHPKAPDTLFNIASCYQALNQEEKKEAALKELMQHYPNSEITKKYKQSIGR